MRKLADLKSDLLSEINQVIVYELNPHKQMSLPEIGKLSLESIAPAQQRMLASRRILEENDDRTNVFMMSE